MKGRRHMAKAACAALLLAASPLGAENAATSYSLSWTYSRLAETDWRITTLKGDNERHLAVPCFISERPASNNWYSATYNIAGSLSFKIEDGEDPSMLTAGIYQSSVYLFIVSN